jgi:hypothetical protein
MADQEEATKIVVEVVDKFSRPLANLKRELEGLSNKGGEGATKTAKSFDTLRTSIHTVASTVTGTLMPSLRVLGIGFAGVAGTLATFVAGLKSLGGSIVELTRLSTETKISVDKMRELEAVGRRVGITSEQMRAGFRGFSEEMDRLRKGVAGPNGLLQNFFAQNKIPWLGPALRGLNDVNKQLDVVLETVDRISNPRDKRRVLERLQLPPNLAQIPRAERERAIEEYRKTVGPLDKATKDSAQRFDEAMTNMATAWEKFINRLAAKGGLDEFTKLLNFVSGSAGKIADEVDKAARDFASIYSDLVKINALLKDMKPGGGIPGIPGSSGKDPGYKDWDKKSWWQRLWPQWDKLTPGPTGLQGGDNKDEAIKVIKTGTSEGVVDAFKKMALDAGGDSAAASGGSTFGGASVIRASLGGGGGGGGGRRGGPGGDPASPDSDASATPAVRSLAMDRARFAKELDANPALREKVLGIAAGENKDPTAANAVIESMMNRASQRGTTLEQAARLYGKEKGGYYAGYDPGSLSRPEIRKRMEDALKRALSGSNASGYATDNSSGGLAERERSSGSFRFHHRYGGESFFSPGTSGRGAAGRERYERWRKNLQEQEIPLPRARPPEAEPAVPRARLMEAANQTNQFARVEGDALVRIDLAGLPHGRKAGAVGGGVFSDVQIHSGNTVPLASESA